MALGKAKNQPTIFKNISQLLTLAPAARKGGRRITRDDLGIVAKAAMVACAGRIVWVGPERQLTSTKLKSLGLSNRARSVDLKGRVVLPALTECHTHLIFAGTRAEDFELRNQGVTYQEIAAQGGGILSTVRATRKATLAELTALGQRRAERFVRQGVTTIEIKSGYGLDTASEIKSLRAAKAIRGPRTVSTFLGAHAVAPEAASVDEYMDELLATTLPKVAKLKLAERVDIFIEKGFFTVAHGERLLKAARELGLAATVHADQLSLSGGAELGTRVGAQSVDHVVQVGSNEIAQLASSSTVAVLLPAADLYLKMKYPPARELLDQGVRVAIASDFNPGTCPTQDVSLVGLLARLEMKMTLPEVLVAYTYNAAGALGLDHELGSLEPEKLCDFITLDGRWEDLFFSIGEHPVAQVWRESRELV